MKFLNTIIIILLLSLLSGCATLKMAVPTTIHIKGSDTMYQLISRLAEEYMKNNEGVAIYVEGGGTGTGVNALSNRTADICVASRTLRASETKLLAENFSSVGMSVRIAKDALSIYFNRQNPIQNLTTAQLRNIYIGEYNNWSEVGGINEPILVLNRLPNSGTYVYLKDYVLKSMDYTENSVNISTYKSLLEKIELSRNAIGYGGMWNNNNVKACKIDGKEPTWKNVMNEDYPLSRYLYFYTISSPDGEVRKFIDWVLSPQGQKIIKDVGYFPIWEFW